MLLRWHLDHGFVAIPKSVDPERIAANFAITGFSLTSEEVGRIDGWRPGERRGEDRRMTHPPSAPARSAAAA